MVPSWRRCSSVTYRRVCAFLAPRHPGDSATIIDRLTHSRALRLAAVAVIAACGSSAPPREPPGPPPPPAPRAGLAFHLSELITYRGICDASAAAGLPGGLIAIGDDEDNHLRIYDAVRGGDPIEVIDTREHLAD